MCDTADYFLSAVRDMVYIEGTKNSEEGVWGKVRFEDVSRIGEEGMH